MSNTIEATAIRKQLSIQDQVKKLQSEPQTYGWLVFHGDGGKPQENEELLTLPPTDINGATWEQREDSKATLKPSCIYRRRIDPNSDCPGEDKWEIVPYEEALYILDEVTFNGKTWFDIVGEWDESIAITPQNAIQDKPVRIAYRRLKKTEKAGRKHVGRVDAH